MHRTVVAVEAGPHREAEASVPCRPGRKLECSRPVPSLSVMAREPTHSRTTAALSWLTFAGITATAVALGGAGESGKSLWYRRLRKPPFQPPAWVFAPVWTALYGLIATSGWRVWKARGHPGRTKALGWWATQLLFNSAWSHLFFRKRKPRAALGDIGLLLGSVGLYTRAARSVDPAAPYFMAPYLGWVGFASLLNEEIVRRNP